MTPAEALAAFAERLATDAALRDRLAPLRNHADFAAACVTEARAHGFAFSEADVRDLLQQRHLFWLQRHIL